MSGRDVVLGVDGGGTKTDVVVADLTGAVLASVSTAGTNHESIGVEQMTAVLAAVALLSTLGPGR